MASRRVSLGAILPFSILVMASGVTPRLSGENSARLVKIVLKIQAATLGCGSPTGIPSFATSQLKTFFNLLHFSE